MRIRHLIFAICFILSNCPQVFSQTKSQIQAYTLKQLQQAKNGNVKAQLLIAQAYKLGKGVPKDMDKAAYWNQQAAMNGSIDGIKRILYDKYDYFYIKKDSIYAECQFWKEQLAYAGSSIEMEQLADGYSPLNLIWGWDKNYGYSLLSFFDYCFNNAIFWANLHQEKDGQGAHVSEVLNWLQRDNKKCQEQLSALKPSVRSSIGLGDSVLVQKCMTDLLYTLKYNMWEGKEYRFADPLDSFLGKTDLSLKEAFEAYDRKYRSGTKLDFQTLYDFKIEKRPDANGYSYSVRATTNRISNKQKYIIMIDITPEKKINTFNLMEIVK